jgi:Uncharacterized protein conserved in archaea
MSGPDLDDDSTDVLELDTRKEIFDYVQENPGVHFSQLKRDLEMETGLLQYHLDTLEEYDVLVSEDHQGKRRVFVAQALDEAERTVLSSLRYETTRHILLFLLEEGPARNRDIADTVGVSPPTVSWHISRLVDEAVVTEVTEGRTTFYAVEDEELTMGLLVRYQESFVDRAVDRVIDFWG